LVPVPQVASLAELNEQLTTQCQRDQERTTRGKPGTVASLLIEDRAAMLPIPAKQFEARRETEVAADSLSLVVLISMPITTGGYLSSLRSQRIGRDPPITIGLGRRGRGERGRRNHRSSTPS